MSDIYEIGSDGSFEIPSPPKIKQKSVIYETPAIDKIIPPTPPSSHIKEDPSNKSLLEGIESGEYKVFLSNDNNSIDVIVRLDSNEKLESIKLIKAKDNDIDSKLIFKTNTRKLKVKVTVPANYSVSQDNVSSKCWNDYIVTHLLLSYE